ncbi:MAG: M48 family metallopeptidase [Algisphaera sp.]
MPFIRPLVIFLFLVIALPLGGCSVNPATGRLQFNVIGEAKEIALGVDAQPQFLNQNGGEVPSARLRNYVTSLGHRLAEVSERPQLPWEFHVLDSAQINAFALPGGKVFITRGLLSHMSTEAQLAGVLGHEVGHVTAQHVSTRMSRAIGLQVGLIAVGAAAAISNESWLNVLGVGASVGGGAYLLKFGRDQESQSDELGVRYMTKLGYDPRAQIEVMGILKEASGGGHGSEFFATHPLPDTRIKRLGKHLKKHYIEVMSQPGLKVGRANFQANVLDEIARMPSPRAGQKLRK